MSASLKLYTDGGSRGNPGPAGYGFVVYSGAGKVLKKCGNYLGQTTNNQAEYRGLVEGLDWVLQHHPACDLEIYMDSLLIVNQIKGLYKVKTPSLLPHYQQATALLAKLNSYQITHVRRHLNSVADNLANQAMDARSSIS